MNTTPENLSDLILNRKRERTYDALAKLSGGVLTRSNIQRMATTRQHKGLPSLKVIQALAKVLGVPESRVLAAAGVSVGIAPDWGSDLVIRGGLDLHPESQRMLLDMAEHMRWWSQEVESAKSAPDNVTPLRPRADHVDTDDAEDAGPDLSQFAADTSGRKRQEGDIDPERPQDYV